MTDSSVAVPAASLTRGSAALRLRSLRVTRGQRLLAGLIGLAAVVGATASISAGSAGGPSYRLVPAGRHGLPDWLAGPLHGLGLTFPPHTLAVVFGCMLAAWVVLLLVADDLPARPVVAAVVLVYVIVLLGPPLLSRDVFDYLAYGRNFGLHSLDPYGHGAGVIRGDATHPFICCLHSPDPYGPGFSLLSAALAHLPLATAFWVLKSILTLSALGAVALVWRCAKLLGRPPVPAVIAVGLNPVAVVFAAGGSHNDWLMMAITLGGMAIWLGGSRSTGAGVTVAATAVKLSALVVAPLMIAASRPRRGPLLAALAVGAGVVVLLELPFGSGAIDGLHHALVQQQSNLFLRDVPEELGALLPGVTDTAIRSVLTVLALGVAGWQLVRVWRGADWITAAAWTMLAVLASSSWLLPWYLVWVLPLAALGRGRGLRVMLVLATAYVTWARAPLILDAHPIPRRAVAHDTHRGVRAVRTGLRAPAAVSRRGVPRRHAGAAAA